ncbi:hypothetical protein D1872_171140 [compost metagenome]
MNIEKITSVTGQYKFLVKKKADREEYFLDRFETNNRRYILEVASLCFHKALFGIAELRALDKFKGELDAGGFRMSIAINTYYTIYHLIVLNMLLDEQHELKVRYRKINQKGSLNFEVSEKVLNSPEETPDHWNKRKDLESDIATMINHSDIKDYLKKVKKRRKEVSVSVNPVQEIIYKSFIAENCSLVLYEKVSYIRDRVVYRPTIVIENTKGHSIQTSADVRKEIDSLPNWKKLYSTVVEIHNAMLKVAEQDKFYRNLLRFSWEVLTLPENEEYLRSLGWTNEDINNYKDKYRPNDLQFIQYVSHLLEICDIERLRKDVDELWNPIKRKFMDKKEELFSLHRVKRDL